MSDEQQEVEGEDSPKSSDGWGATTTSRREKRLHFHPGCEVCSEFPDIIQPFPCQLPGHVYPDHGTQRNIPGTKAAQVQSFSHEFGQCLQADKGKVRRSVCLGLTPHEIKSNNQGEWEGEALTAWIYPALGEKSLLLTCG